MKSDAEPFEPPRESPKPAAAINSATTGRLPFENSLTSGMKHMPSANSPDE